MQVPFVDLKAQYERIKPAIDNAIKKVIEETAFIGGKYVNEFEQQFAELYGVKHCISVANGTDSLYIIMKMLGIGPGDEVITVANSWISSSETITQTGARPVFVDINPVYYSIDESLIESKITNNTKAIIPVHLYGQMCNMEAVMGIAHKHGLHVIEDCAQSHFSELNNTRAGLRGIASSFSFYPGKNLGAYGDAGCIITNDDDFAEKCRMYARHGAKVKHKHEMEGVNSRLDGMQASILLAKLPHILHWTEERIAVSRWYSEFLSDVSEIQLPEVRPNSKHSFHLYVVRTESRDALANHLKENGVETAIHYPVALPNMNAYSYLGYTKKDFPIASQYESRILSLPIYPEMTREMVEYVSNSIKSFFSQS